jgi:hypothetical protein
MSAEYVIVFFGVKVSITEPESDQLVKATHPHQSTARQFGLDTAFADCSAFESDYQLFIGKQLAVIGCEYDWSQAVGEIALLKAIETTKAALLKAGFNEKPALLLQFQADQ